MTNVWHILIPQGENVILYEGVHVQCSALLVLILCHHTSRGRFSFVASYNSNVPQPFYCMYFYTCLDLPVDFTLISSLTLKHIRIIPEFYQIQYIVLSIETLIINFNIKYDLIPTLQLQTVVILLILVQF